MKSFTLKNMIDRDLLFRTTKHSTVFYKISNGDVFSIKNTPNKVFRNIVFNEKLRGINKTVFNEAKEFLHQKNILAKASDGGE